MPEHFLSQMDVIVFIINQIFFAASEIRNFTHVTCETNHMLAKIFDQLYISNVISST